MFGEMLLEFGCNQPIFLGEIIKRTGLSRPRVNQLIKEYIYNGQLARFSEGIFYVPNKTILGNSSLDIRKVIEKKYIQNDGNIFGIFTGIAILNSFGFTNQVANAAEIVTNGEKTRVRETSINGQKIILRKSRCEINKENYKIYMLLELFNQIGLNEEIDNTKIIKFIKENKLDAKQIITYMSYFPGKVSKNFNRSGVVYEII